ncbi:hypothetical protein OSTOST_15320, partial [Ostertagia ostertagi]
FRYGICEEVEQIRYREGQEEKTKKLRKKKLKSKCDEALVNGGDEGNDVGEMMDAEDEIASDEENVVKAVTSGNAGKKHLSDLQKLKESDPEFYKFLQQQDADLLQFHASDEEDEETEAHFEDGEEEDFPDEEREGRLWISCVCLFYSNSVSSDSDETGKHLPKAKKDSSGRLIFDGRMLDHLQSVLDPEDQKRRIQAEDVRFAVEAFNACVSRVGADIDLPKYIINEQRVFDETVRLCFEKLGDAFTTLISGSAQVKTEEQTDEEVKHLKLKHIKKYQSPLKQYLSSILKFANEVQTSDVIISTLKAMRRLVDLFAHFKKITKNLCKVLVRIWSRKTLDCRVGAYVCMMQLVKSHPEHFVSLYKNCYLGFVTNSREVTAETWPLLHFMH